MWDKYITYEKLKITSISGICWTIYYNDSYLSLSGKRKLLRFENSGEEFL